MEKSINCFESKSGSKKAWCRRQRSYANALFMADHQIKKQQLQRTTFIMNRREFRTTSISLRIDSAWEEFRFTIRQVRMRQSFVRSSQEDVNDISFAKGLSQRINENMDLWTDWNVPNILRREDHLTLQSIILSVAIVKSMYGKRTKRHFEF